MRKKKKQDKTRPDHIKRQVMQHITTKSLKAEKQQAVKDTTLKN